MTLVTRIVFSVWSVFVACTAAQAQYFQFSQYNYAEQRVTPTAPANSDYASATFLYRNQAAAPGLKLNTNMLSLSYPLLSRNTGRRWSGVGISVMDDRTAGIFDFKEASLSYAVNVFLSEFESVSAGFKTLYQQRRIDLTGLYTGSQYIPDRGFDGSVFNGENFGTFRSDYFTFSSGIAWQHTDKSGTTIGYWNVSWFDFNKPDDSFLGSESQLNSTLVASAGFRAIQQNNMSLFPELLYTRSASNNVLNVGMITRCHVKRSPRQGPFYVDIISKYVFGRSAIAGVQFHNENFSFGFSYDMLMSRRNASNVGAFEVGLQLRRLVIPDLKSKNAKKKPTQNKTTTTAKAKPVTQPKPVVEKTQTADSTSLEVTGGPVETLGSRLQHKHDSIVAQAKPGQINHDPFEIEKVVLHFNFEFNSSELDDASTKYLDELSVALKENSHLKIRLTGHTDNVGTASFNQRLSLYRANAIKDYLVSNGISTARIKTDGKGMSEPVVNNNTAENRAKNRRVELTILYEE